MEWLWQWRRTIMVTVMLGSLALPGLAAASTAPDVNNSIIPGGCSSPADCSNKIHNGDAVTRNLYSSFHITAISVNQAVPGTVTKSGLVIVNGKTVATRAMSFGRIDYPGSFPSHGVFERATSVSFASSQLAAFVHMTNGRFDFAVIKSCGNLVLATPVVVTPPPPKVVTPAVTPAPAPAPVVNVTQIQSQTQTQIQTPAPAPAPVQVQAQPTPTPTPTPAPAPQPVAATIPQTGASTIGLVGCSTLLICAAYWWRSRRSLRLALRRG